MAARLSSARSLTDRLFDLLRPGVLYERPIPERHRLIFYLGHLEAFDRNLLARDRGASQPDLDRLFAFGIDPLDGELPNEPVSAWPAEREVRAYCRSARASVDLGAAASLTGSRGHSLIDMAIEHRLMHAETLAYALHRLPPELKQAQSESDPPARLDPHGPSMIDVPPGRATLGLSRDGRFGWDNEFEPHEVEVPGFRIGSFMVTNAEFVEFVRAGGYETESLWRRDGWRWIQRSGRATPPFWRLEQAGWIFRGMFRDRPLPPDEPVWVSHAEAEAYAAWRGMRLPTEAEWHRTAYGAADGSEREYPWGDDAPTIDHGNFDSHRWDPTPVGSYPHGRSAFGAFDLLGNGWEWTSTRFAPFPGFEANRRYPGYSADFFEGRHYVLKGGSPRTDAVLLRRSFRNWFQPHYPYLYAGFRLAAP